MKSIRITTWYEVEEIDGEVRKLTADTNVPDPQSLVDIFNMHNDKQTVIERKLLK